MIIVSDTSPLLYLLLIGQIELLPQLHGYIVIPDVVRSEMLAANAPAELRRWIANPPGWLTVQSVTIEIDDKLKRLNAGEQAAIALAETLNADLLLMDERDGRRVAMQRGLRVVGVLGILDDAAVQGLIDVAEAVTKLKQTNFRISPKLIQSLLDRHSSTQNNPDAIP